MCKNLEYISLLQSRAMLAEPSKMHRNRPLAVHPATIYSAAPLALALAKTRGPSPTSSILMQSACLCKYLVFLCLYKHCPLDILLVYLYTIGM